MSGDLPIGGRTLTGDVFDMGETVDLGAEIRGVFFDAGNTLTYLDVEWIAGRLRDDGWEMDESALVYGQNVAAYELSRMALLKKYASDADRITPYFARVLELAGIPEGFAGECANILMEEHAKSILWRSVPDFVAPTLAELRRRGYILGVISNSDGRIKPLLERHNLTSLLTFIIDSAAVGVEKPDPEIFRMATDAAETQPHKCVFVGDIYAVDIEGARRSGLKGVLLDPLCLHSEFHCARITTLTDLLDILPPIKGVAQEAGDE